MGILNYVAITAATDVIAYDTGGSASAAKPYLEIDASTDVVYWKTSGVLKGLGVDEDVDTIYWIGGGT